MAHLTEVGEADMTSHCPTCRCQPEWRHLPWPRGHQGPSPRGWPHTESCTVTHVARTLANGGTATTGFGCNCGTPARTWRLTSGRRDARVHLGHMRSGQRMLTSTMCGRWIGDDWSTLDLKQDLLTDDVSCVRCAEKFRLLMARQS